MCENYIKKQYNYFKLLIFVLPDFNIRKPLYYKTTADQGELQSQPHISKKTLLMIPKIWRKKYVNSLNS